MSRYCFSDDMSGVTFPTNGQCNNDRNDNQRRFTVVLMCASIAFVATYFYYGFAEIQSELSSLREEFYPVAGHKQKSTQVKKSKCDKRNENDDVKKIVSAALEQYDADKTTKADFGLESSGGVIISTGETEPFEALSRSGSLFGIPICQSSNGPRQIIQPGVMPGECWAFKGSKGNVIIKLVGPVFIDGVSLEHISKSISPTGLIDTAPKDFSIWGLETENDPGDLLGQFTYDIDGSTVQFFPIDESPKSYEYVEFKIHSNHGNRIFTCVYRLRIHGVLDLSKSDY